MTFYPHFAAPNLMLENGYTVEQTSHGDVYSYIDEDRLEACVRRILVRTPKRLNGRQLRFVRRGLSTSQEAFGALIERDAQTVARIEKSEDPIPRVVDLTIRARYFQLYEPSVSIGEILSLVDCTARIPSERILLSYSNGEWCYRFDIPKFKVEFSESGENTVTFIEDGSDNLYSRHRRLIVNTTLDVSSTIDESDSPNLPLPVTTKFSIKPSPKFIG